MKTVMQTIIAFEFLILALASASHASYVYTTAPGYDSGGAADQGAGGMIMLDIRFAPVTDTGGIVVGGTLTMDPQPTTVYLAPRPLGSFDPAAAWGVLDGTAYSRRLGFDDANRPRVLADQVHASTGGYIWIEQLSASPELKCYYAQSALCKSSTNPITATYTFYGEIFGTGTSSTKWQWDGKMDHNAYAVDLADIQMGSGRTFSATYKIYIGDSTGNEILNPDLTPKFTSATEVWTWTTPVPEPAATALLALGSLSLLARRRV